MASAPLSVLGAIVNERARNMFLVAVAFVALLSMLGHKEWRFVVYAVPMFNVSAAKGASWM